MHASWCSHPHTLGYTQEGEAWETRASGHSAGTGGPAARSGGGMQVRVLRGEWSSWWG